MKNNTLYVFIYTAFHNFSQIQASLPYPPNFVPFFLRSLGTTCAVHILPVCIGIHWSMGNNQGSQLWRKLIFLFPDTINYQDLLSYGKTPCLKFHTCWHFVWLNFVLISPVTIVTNTVSSYVAHSFSYSC